MRKIIKISPTQARRLFEEYLKQLDLLQKTVAPIMDFKGLNRCKSLSYNKPPQKMYRYFEFEAAKSCIKNNTIRFSQPSTWNDGFEKRFYSTYCDYSNILTKEEQQVETPQLYACCFTQNKTSEAAWKVYSYNDNQSEEKICIQFTIDVNVFRRMLEEYANANNCMVYEGPMIYFYSDEEINTIHQRGARRHDILFENFKLDNYLNLLRIKRQAFYYEGEYRFFVIPQEKNNVMEDYLYIPINWDKVIAEIKIESKVDDSIKKGLKSFLKTNNISANLQDFNLNKMEERIVIEK